ncbi:MAG: FtsQ-type POTRA domain-containing protein [Clostridiales bacterium]|nr:FtsQ-type POTRA domain-containing protein [Clostridiales bacterium]
MDKRDGAKGRGGAQKSKYQAPASRRYNPNIQRVTHEDFDDEEYAKAKRRLKKKRQMRMRKIKAVLAFLLILAILAVILLLTPVFNVKNISVLGNEMVTLEQIEAQAGSVVGENLFAVSKSSVRNMLLDIPLISDVRVSKKLIPPTVILEISEFVPAGYIELNGRFTVVNEELETLENSQGVDINALPIVSGAEIKSTGRVLQLTDPEKEEALKVFLKTLLKTGLTSQIDYIDMSAMTDIKFSYDGRIEASCGSSLELSRKLRMFKETVSSSALDEKARGTIDLSTPGKAIYAPYE